MPSILNYILFDQNFVYVDGGFKRVSTAADRAQELLRLDIPIHQDGYIFIYVSNESQWEVNVFFDELKVTHEHLDIVQHDDFYPFGLAFNQDKERSLKNKYLYNGKELQDELGLDWYDYGARMYDPALGRWHVVDALADHPRQLSWSPYHYVKNNPINMVDPDGNCGDCFIDLAFIAYDLGEIIYDYATTGKVDAVSTAALGADVGALFVPGVTGAGVATRIGAEGTEQAVKHGDDLVKLADDAVDSFKKNFTDKGAKKDIHGNSLDSDKETVLYELQDNKGNKLKNGVTSEKNPENRYTKEFMKDKKMVELDKGSRKDMVKKEREIVEKDPGPLNKEPWAGSKRRENQ